jgi:DNA-binding NtrC family response regulator
MKEVRGRNPNRRSPLSIVLVDDDALIRMSTVEMLQDLGHLVQDVARGRDALALLSGDAPIDVLIADLALSDMNGADLAAEDCNIRQDLRVVFASGHSKSMINLDPSRIKFVFLSKPYDARQLSEALAKLA